MIPPPGAAPSAEMRSLLETRAGGCEPPSGATAPGPATRPNPRSPLPSAATAPQPFLEIEHPRARVRPQPLQGLRRQQRNVVAGGAGVAEIIAPTRLIKVT